MQLKQDRWLAKAGLGLKYFAGCTNKHFPECKLLNHHKRWVCGNSSVTKWLKKSVPIIKKYQCNITIHFVLQAVTKIIGNQINHDHHQKINMPYHINHEYSQESETWHQTFERRICSWFYWLSITSSETIIFSSFHLHLVCYGRASVNVVFEIYFSCDNVATCSCCGEICNDISIANCLSECEGERFSKLDYI